MTQPQPGASGRERFETYPHLTDDQLDLFDRISEISEEGMCADWIYWHNGPQFAPMVQWLEMFAQRRNQDVQHIGK